MNIQKRTYVLIVAVAIVLLGAGYVAYGRTHAAQADFETVEAVRGDVRLTVDLTGKVAAASDADLSFERSGTVTSVKVVAGDKVVRGQFLASLSAADTAAQLAQARAGLAAARARLEGVREGIRPEDMAVSEAQVAAAEAVVAEARKALADKVVDANAKADDAVRGKTDQFYHEPTGTLPTLSFVIADSAMTNALSWARVDIEADLRSWQASLKAVDADPIAASADAKARLGDVRAFLDEIAFALDKIDLRANSGLTQAAVDGWKSNVSTARSNIASALSALSTGEATLRAAENAVAVAKTQKDLKASGPTSNDLAAQEAVVAQALAAVQAADAQLAKASLRAPFDGIVSRVVVHLGEMAAPGAPAISLISADHFEIDALASETQVARLHAGDAVAVTLDGYGTAAVFPAEVLRIDPAPVTSDGATGYPVKLRFVQEDSRILAGMTANIHVEAASATDVVVIPRQAMLLNGDGAMVLLKEGSAFVQRPVTTGLVSETLVEIKEGLKEGDAIADFGGNR